MIRARMQPFSRRSPPRGRAARPAALSGDAPSLVLKRRGRAGEGERPEAPRQERLQELRQIALRARLGIAERECLGRRGAMVRAELQIETRREVAEIVRRAIGPQMMPVVDLR